MKIDKSENRFHPDLEMTLLADAASVTSKILGIRIRMHPIPHDYIHAAADLQMMTLTWKGLGGLRLLSDRLSLCSLLAVEPDRTDKDSLTSLMEKYSHRFSEELCLKWSDRTGDRWETDPVRVEPVPRLGRILNSRGWISRSYSICSGPQVLLNVTAVADFRLLSVWNHQLRRAESDSVLPVSIELGQTCIKAQTIMDLKPGDVVSLDQISGNSVNLIMNNHKFAEGRIIEVSGKIGIKVIALTGP